MRRRSRKMHRLDKTCLGTDQEHGRLHNEDGKQQQRRARMYQRQASSQNQSPPKTTSSTNSTRGRSQPVTARAHQKGTHPDVGHRHTPPADNKKRRARRNNTKGRSQPRPQARRPRASSADPAAGAHPDDHVFRRAGPVDLDPALTLPWPH